MPTFKLDGKEIPFEPGESIIKAASRAGIEIPHYCWHPGLSAPANCRMCLVEIKPAANQRPVMLDIVRLDPKIGDYVPVQKPKLLPACQMAAVEGQEVLSDLSGHVKEARSHVQEFLLLNHPVDCPICDQAGECKLQDYWLEHQATPKRMKDEPVHKPKAVSFGPTIVYDAERCVMCTRCVRFMEEVAKDPVLDMRERGNLNEITVAPGRQLDGNYTFMTEHVCPVGALTTKDFRFKARVWFLRSANSVCQGCATGCNTHLDYDPRYNKVQRYRVRDNEAVNKYWMCDPGMLTYRLAHERRVDEAKVKGKGTTFAKAIAEAKKILDSAPREVTGIVLSAAHSQEDNYALLAFAEASGIRNVYVAAYPDGYADDILIDKDKNSNRNGVKKLAPSAKSFGHLLQDLSAGAVSHLLVLGSAIDAEDDAARNALARATSIVVLATWTEGSFVENATVLLPASSWAEASGTYVNRQGISQVTEKGIEPIGVSRPAWQIVLALATEVGSIELPFKKLKELRGALAPAIVESTPDVGITDAGWSAE